MSDAHKRSRRYARVSRLPALSEPLDPEIEAYFERAEARGHAILNLHLACAHAPKIIAAKSPLAMALRNDCESPRRYRELAIVRVGQAMECAYELDHHMPILMECGFSQAQADGLQDWRAHKDLYDDKSLAILAWVDSMADNKGAVDDAAFAELSRLFTPRELVEIGYNAAVYFANALILKSFRIEIDAPHTRTTPGTM